MVGHHTQKTIDGNQIGRGLTGYWGGLGYRRSLDSARAWADRYRGLTGAVVPVAVVAAVAVEDKEAGNMVVFGVAYIVAVRRHKEVDKDYLVVGVDYYLVEEYKAGGCSNCHPCCCDNCCLVDDGDV